MRDEISAAVCFLAHLIEKNENCSVNQLEEFKKCLSDLLAERFQDHWFPEQPCKGQGYRCIRLNENVPKDEVLDRAAQASGLKYEDLNLPLELTLWVDPKEVCCRFGEHRGSYCTLASFTNLESVSIGVPDIEEVEEEDMIDSSEKLKEEVNAPSSDKDRTTPVTTPVSTPVTTPTSKASSAAAVGSGKKAQAGRGSPKQSKSGQRNNKNWSHSNSVFGNFMAYQHPWQAAFPGQWLPPHIPFPQSHAVLGSAPNGRWGGPMFHNSPFRFHWSSHRMTLKV